jgi:hypothetical protein
MTSTVTDYSSLIDTTFPIPGADNDTQGFRNNFGNIKIALDSAAAEINDLQVIQSSLVALTSDAPSDVYGVSGNLRGQIYADDSTVAIAYDNYTSTSTAIWNIIDTVRASKALQWRSSAPATSTGTNGDVQGMVYASTNTLYICFQDHDSSTTTNIWSKVAMTGGTW